jgi:hypothetical protein
VLAALLDRQTAGSLGWPVAPGWLQQLVLSALRLRSRFAAAGAALSRWLGRQPRARFYSQRPTPSYGDSFRLEQLGPPALLQKLNQPRSQRPGSPWGS